MSIAKPELLLSSRLILVTGKGGVGKTWLATHFLEQLRREGKDAHLYFFSPPPLLPASYHHHLESNKSIREYVQLKFGNVIGSWIADTSFFKALVNMIPGLGQLITLGHIVNDLMKNPQRVAILDAPSSGHAQVMFDGLNNFKDIFQAGIIFNDVDKIRQFLQVKHNFEMHIVSLPAEMAIQEALELKAAMQNQKMSYPCYLHMNNCYSLIDDIAQLSCQQIPPFLQKKLEIEKSVLQAYMAEFDFTWPHGEQKAYE